MILKNALSSLTKESNFGQIQEPIVITASFSDKNGILELSSVYESLYIVSAMQLSLICIYGSWSAEIFQEDLSLL